MTLRPGTPTPAIDTAARLKLLIAMAGREQPGGFGQGEPTFRAATRSVEVILSTSIPTDAMGNGLATPSGGLLVRPRRPSRLSFNISDARSDVFGCKKTKKTKKTGPPLIYPPPRHPPPPTQPAPTPIPTASLPQTKKRISFPSSLGPFDWRLAHSSPTYYSRRANPYASSSPGCDTGSGRCICSSSMCITA